MSAFIYPLFFRFLIKQQIMKYFAILVILCKLAKVWTFVFYQREKEKWSEIYFRQLTTWMFVELKIKTCHYQSFFIIFNWFSQNLVHTIKKRKLGFTGQDSAGRRRPHRPGFRNSLFPSRASWFSPLDLCFRRPWKSGSLQRVRTRGSKFQDGEKVDWALLPGAVSFLAVFR